MLESIIAIGILLLIAAVFLTLRSANVRATRRIGMPPAPPRAIFNGMIYLAAGGGARFLTGKGAGGGGGSLELFRWGIRLRGFLQLTAPVLELRYAELLDVQLVDGQHGRHGIRLRSEHLPAPVTFVTSQNQEIAKLLQARDVPLIPTVGQMFRLPGDRSASDKQMSDKQMSDKQMSRPSATPEWPRAQGGGRPSGSGQ